MGFKKNNPTCACCGDAGCLPCTPCRYPKNDLVLSLAAGGGSHTDLALAFDGTDAWSSGCAGQLRAVLACGWLRVDYFPDDDCPAGTPTTCNISLAAPGSYSCCPFTLTVPITGLTCPALAGLGYTALTLTSSLPTPQACCCTGQLCVQVVDRCHGGPRAGVPVSVADSHGTAIGGGLTDDAGRFCLSPVAAGLYTLAAGGGGCLPSSATVYVPNCYTDVSGTLALACTPFPSRTIVVVCCALRVPGATVTLVQGGTTIFSGATGADGTVAFTPISAAPVSYTVSADYCQTAAGTIFLGDICQSATHTVGLQLLAAYGCCGLGATGLVWPQGVLPRQVTITTGLGSATATGSCGWAANIAGTANHVDDTFYTVCDGLVDYSGPCSGCVSVGSVRSSNKAYHRERTANSGAIAESVQIGLAYDGGAHKFVATVVVTWPVNVKTVTDFEYTPCCCTHNSDTGADTCNCGFFLPGVDCACPCGDVVVTVPCEPGPGGPVFTYPPAGRRDCPYYTAVVPAGAAYGVATQLLDPATVTPTGFNVSVTLAPGDGTPPCSAANTVWTFEGPPDPPPGSPCYLPPPPNSDNVTVTP